MGILEIIKICIWIIVGVLAGVGFRGSDIPRSVFWLTYIAMMFQLISNTLDAFA